MTHQPLQGVQMADVLRYSGGRYTRATVGIIRECPLAVAVNGEPVATIACLGLHTDELAVGFLCSEGYIAAREDLQGIDLSVDGLTVNVRTKTALTLRPDHGLNVASSGARSRTDEAPASAKSATAHASLAPRNDLPAHG